MSNKTFATKSSLADRLFCNIDGNNVEASSNASRQAQQAEPVVGQDASGGSSVGQVPNAYGSGVGVVIDVQREEYKKKDLVHEKELPFNLKVKLQPIVQVTETRNADGREMGDGIPTQSSAVAGASEWAIL
uniref:Uncharacterized protein n=1 Tax=Tanacetum cinerariifolium TaxID=118510 RepID=A0A6L2K9M7_TANCI|nr:hypothetical protein [Tanacetum cinerariifolium]